MLFVRHRGVIRILFNISDTAFCENSYLLKAITYFHTIFAKRYILNAWQWSECPLYQLIKYFFKDITNSF